MLGRNRPRAPYRWTAVCGVRLLRRAPPGDTAKWPRAGKGCVDAKPRSWPQNIHLVARWLGTLDKKVERYSTGSHEDYRVFMSAEPAPSPESHIIPQGILENAIKITNEPPTGMYANLHKALDLFTQVRRLPLPCTPAPVPGLSSPGDPGRMEPLGLQS